MTAVPRAEEAHQDLARVLAPRSIQHTPRAGAARLALGRQTPLRKFWEWTFLLANQKTRGISGFPERSRFLWFRRVYS